MEEILEDDPYLDPHDIESAQQFAPRILASGVRVLRDAAARPRSATRVGQAGDADIVDPKMPIAEALAAHDANAASAEPDAELSTQVAQARTLLVALRLESTEHPRLALGCGTTKNDPERRPALCLRSSLAEASLTLRLIIHVSNQQRGIDGFPAFHEVPHDRERGPPHQRIRRARSAVEMA